MKNSENAAGHPAGAGTFYAYAQLQALLVVAELAIARHAAEQSASALKHAYRERIAKFERKHGQLGARMDPALPEHQLVIEYTANAYEAYRAAQRQVYNIKRRLDTAMRRVDAAGGAR